MAITNDQLLAILEEAKNRIEAEELPFEKGEEFENKVAEVIIAIANEQHISGTYQTGAQTFPDIQLDGFGIEVKFSKSTKWESTGNSTFEGTFDSNVKKDVYVFFGQKHGNYIQVRYDTYENCLSDVKITHSPRFMISMNLNHEETVLAQLGLTYEQYRTLPKLEKENRIKSYLGKDLVRGENIVELNEESAISAKIRNINNFDAETKRKIRAELYVQFPIILSSSPIKYRDAAAYLIKKYNAYAPSLRDLFSAGGQEQLNFSGTQVLSCPQKYSKIYHEAKDFEFILENTSNEELFDHWRDYGVTLDEINQNKITVWKRLINQFGEPHGQYRPSDFYDGGYPFSELTLD